MPKPLDSRQLMPKARENGLVVQELPDELLVYDTNRNHALCLNETAWRVMETCDGETTVKDAALRISGKLRAEVDENFIWAAIEKLAKKDLLEPGSVPANLPKLGRRDLIRAAGALAVALPLVTTIVAPSPVSAQSAGGGACVPFGQPCCASSQCCGTAGPPVCLGQNCPVGDPPAGGICCASNMSGFLPPGYPQLPNFPPVGDFMVGATQPDCAQFNLSCCSGTALVAPGTSCTPAPGGGFDCTCACAPFLSQG